MSKLQNTQKRKLPDNALNDYRLEFDIEYIKPLFPEYKQLPLEIWHTYTNTALEELVSNENHKTKQI